MPSNAVWARNAREVAQIPATPPLLLCGCAKVSSGYPHRGDHKNGVYCLTAEVVPAGLAG